ncbi:MAG: methyltransferase, partial [Pseudomonadota bacterium]|nr:methyltransferase [Pseudomonadota bacterium]
FIRKAAGLLKKGGVLWIVANRHLPYEAELKDAFKRVDMIADSGGYKVFEAVK